MVLTRDQKEFSRKLQEMDLPGLEVLAPETEKEIMAGLPGVNILLANPPIAFKYINHAKNVVWMQSVFAGVDAMMQPSLSKDYILTNVKDTYGDAMAEFVFGYILMFEKEILENLGFQREKVWNQRPFGTLKEKTIGIMGAGSIGKEIAKISNAFGAKTIGFKNCREEVEFFDEVYGKEDIKHFLAESDYVVMVLPKTVETDDIMNEKTLEMMKKSAVLINVGRGNAVNENDLVNALKSGVISKAVLDVFKEEPLSRESELWSLPNVFITPHVSGYTLSERIFEIFEENYRRFIEGEELIYKVDLGRGY